MDEDFDYFLSAFGPGYDRRDVSPSTIEWYRGKLPEQLLIYWQVYGWCGYAEGAFWTVNPREYESIISGWLKQTRLWGTDVYHVIARSAFGTLYLWGEQSGDSLTISAANAYYIRSTSIFTRAQFDFALRCFFSGLTVQSNDYENLFGVAKNKLGRLSEGEMYGFTPALALGGKSVLAGIEKVSAVEHLTFLSQVSELEELIAPNL
ncbi:hypothetical protein C4J95_0832 [Pseudomonas orientalis]|uniref:GAD-like domain-containing protein n=1 Tax=Pseudomonas orientalis TaxID=76758 RepID=UPI000F55D88A|nr:GAD-like domain-containing protein [Pseudomonas orientalis]AZE92956.1 hypothetical protein C4J96_0822 [Pseudomonas orientalis]AZE98310.1 hypothetical protein C4J95_0832 [Pseudomonas orientalis]